MADSEIMVVDERLLKDKIYIVRGTQVMLDFELAEIYGYETRYFNRQVQNNRERFRGDDFMFQLTEEEFENLKCIFFTSSWGGRRKLPYAFTEQGIYMLMTVLKGELAIEQSRTLIRLFKGIFKFSMQTRKLIYTTNAIESVNSAYKKLNRQRRVFPNPTALLKSLYLSTMEITKKWPQSIRNWGSVYSEFCIMYEGRLPD